MTHRQGLKTNSHLILINGITHSPSVIEKTIVLVGPGRGKRRAEFIAVFDSLFTSKDDPRFADVVSAAGKCMALNVRASAMLPVLNQP